MDVGPEATVAPAAPALAEPAPGPSSEAQPLAAPVQLADSRATKSNGGTKRREYTFAVVIPPSRYSSQKPRPGAAPVTGPSRASNSGPHPQAASGSNQRVSGSTAAQSKDSSTSKRRRTTSSAFSADDEDTGEVQPSDAQKHPQPRKIDKGKGKEKGGDEPVVASRKGKEREVVRPATKRASSEKTKKRRRESRSEDEDDLELSGKETVVKERFRARKGESKQQQRYRAALQGECFASTPDYAQAR